MLPTLHLGGSTATGMDFDATRAGADEDTTCPIKEAILDADEELW